jgi:hypothetical protein
LAVNLFYNLKTTIMKNLFKKKNTEMDFSNLSAILTSGAAAGMAIANNLGKNPQTGGIIGVGLSLLVTGLMTALEDETSSEIPKS